MAEIQTKKTVTLSLNEWRYLWGDPLGRREKFPGIGTYGLTISYDSKMSEISYSTTEYETYEILEHILEGNNNDGL